MGRFVCTWLLWAVSPAWAPPHSSSLLPLELGAGLCCHVSPQSELSPLRLSVFVMDDVQFRRGWRVPSTLPSWPLHRMNLSFTAVKCSVTLMSVLEIKFVWIFCPASECGSDIYIYRGQRSPEASDEWVPCQYCMCTAPFVLDQSVWTRNKVTFFCCCLINYQEHNTLTFLKRTILSSWEEPKRP